MLSDITLLDRLLRLPDVRRANAWVEKHGPIGPRRSDVWRLWQVAIKAPGAIALEWMDEHATAAGFELQVDEAHLLLHQALEAGHLLAADWLYARGVPLVNPREGVCADITMEPIHVAAMAGQAASVTWLANHANETVIEPPEDFPMPPLRLALGSAHLHAVPVVEALLAAGADASRIGPPTNPGNVLENLMDAIYVFESRGKAGSDTFRKLWTLLEDAGASPLVVGRYGRSAAERLEESPQAAWYGQHQQQRQEERARQALQGEVGGRQLPRTSATSPSLLRMSRIRRR